MRGCIRTGAETEFYYQTLRSALDGQPGQAPSPAWVLQSSRSRPTASADWSTTTYRYEGVVFGVSPERYFDESGLAKPLSHRGSIRGFQTVRVCTPSGAMNEVKYSFDETASGVVSERTTYQNCDVGSQPLVRVNTGYNVRRVRTTFDPGVRAYEIVRVLPDIVNTTRWERTTAGWASESTKVQTEYSTRNDAVVVERVTQEGDPSSTGAPRVTTLETDVADAATPNSYFQRVRSRQIVGDDGFGVPKLLSWVETEFDNGAPDGPGHVTASIVHRSDTNAALVARTSFTVDSFGHVSQVTSPEGRVSRLCWDRHRLYPIRVQSHDGRIQESMFSYVTGGLIEAAGPTGIEPVWHLTHPHSRPHENRAEVHLRATVAVRSSGREAVARWHRPSCSPRSWPSFWTSASGSARRSPRWSPRSGSRVR